MVLPSPQGVCPHFLALQISWLVKYLGLVHSSPTETFYFPVPKDFYGNVLATRAFMFRAMCIYPGDSDPSCTHQPLNAQSPAGSLKQALAYSTHVWFSSKFFCFLFGIALALNDLFFVLPTLLALLIHRLKDTYNLHHMSILQSLQEFPLISFNHNHFLLMRKCEFIKNIPECLSGVQFCSLISLGLEIASMRFNWNIPLFCDGKSSLADGRSYCWSQIRCYQFLLVFLVGTDIKMWAKGAFSYVQQHKYATNSEEVQWRCLWAKLLIYLLAEGTLSASPSYFQGKKTFLFHPHPYLKRYTE